ncbi:hypothetical protein FHG87_003162 [Trinorchestia longiramus]|nr:hypothetical protein FHG87_003162 [Trinorchestia longiramus]
MGDFSLPYICWNIRQSRAPGCKLIELIKTKSRPPHISKAARRNYVLDFIMTTSDLRIIGLEVTDKIGEHNMIDSTLQIHDTNARNLRPKLNTSKLQAN